MKPILILLLILSLRADGETPRHAELLPKETNQKIHAILDAVFRMDYDRADQLSLRLIKEQPDYPAGYVYLARSYWSRELNNTRLLSVEQFAAEQFFSRPPIKVDPEREARFVNAADEAIAKSRAWNARNPGDAAGKYLLGAAYQMKASYEFTINRSWWRSASLGNRALGFHEELLSANKNLYDAYLTVGALHYAVGSLPWGLKPIAFLMRYRGSKDAGLKELEIAAANGDLAADDATALLAVLYTREKQYANAIRKLKQLEAKYPENYAVPQDLAAVSLLAGNPKEALAIYRRVLDAGHRGLDRAPILMRMGVAAREAKDLAVSSIYLREALAEKILAETLRSAIHLELGKTLDLGGKRNEAIQHYRLVAGGPELKDLRAEAERLIRERYR